MYPLTKNVDGEGVPKDIFEGWVQSYGCPKIIHSDNDIRFTRPPGWYRSLFQCLGTYTQSGNLYLRTKNPLCEREIGAFKTVMRMLMHNENSRNWLNLVPFAVFLTNNHLGSRTGLTRTELFIGRPRFNF